MLNGVIREGLTGKVIHEKKSEGSNKQGIASLLRGRAFSTDRGGPANAAALSEEGVDLPRLRDSKEVSMTGLKGQEEED